MKSRGDTERRDRENAYVRAQKAKPSRERKKNPEKVEILTTPRITGQTIIQQLNTLIPRLITRNTTRVYPIRLRIPFRMGELWGTDGGRRRRRRGGASATGSRGRGGCEGVEGWFTCWVERGVLVNGHIYTHGEERGYKGRIQTTHLVQLNS
jgi:hypothetical protein